MLSVWIPFCSLKISQKWMHFVDSIECRTTLGIYVLSHTVTYWCLFPIGSMYIYLHLPSFTIKTNHLPTGPMLKTLGLLPFSLPRKTTMKPPVLALKAKPLFGFTKRCAPAEANQHWRFGCEGSALGFLFETISEYCWHGFINYIYPPGNDHVSYLGKRNIIDSTVPCWGGYVSSQDGTSLKIAKENQEAT